MDNMRTDVRVKLLNLITAYDRTDCNEQNRNSENERAVRKQLNESSLLEVQLR